VHLKCWAPRPARHRVEHLGLLGIGDVEAVSCLRLELVGQVEKRRSAEYAKNEALGTLAPGENRDAPLAASALATVRPEGAE